MIPAHTLAALDRYVKHRVLPGGFLTAVLSNDLFGAIARADKENKLALSEICQYIYNELPGDCWGSKDIMWKWVENRFYDSLEQQNQ